MTVKTIILRGEGIGKEGVAAEAITPGQLVAIDASGDIETHQTANIFAQKAFAREDEVVGLGIDVNYAIGDPVKYTVLPPGSEVYGWLTTANNVAIGDLLVSSGSGALEKSAATTEIALAVALEAVNNVSGSDERLKFAIL